MTVPFLFILCCVIQGAKVARLSILSERFRGSNPLRNTNVTVCKLEKAPRFSLWSVRVQIPSVIQKCSYRLMVRILPSQGKDTDSTSVGSTWFFFHIKENIIRSYTKAIGFLIKEKRTILFFQ